ncbi:hypothetical protein M426DRAFT_265118 [Hypoxylon sp. CI-4A]|nr:hypothetical protein M426DRAFT_265118 [Hypoxylon sp. CI-4A]
MDYQPQGGKPPPKSDLGQEYLFHDIPYDPLQILRASVNTTGVEKNNISMSRAKRERSYRDNYEYSGGISPQGVSRRGAMDRSHYPTMTRGLPNVTTPPAPFQTPRPAIATISIEDDEDDGEASQSNRAGSITDDIPRQTPSFIWELGPPRRFRYTDAYFALDEERVPGPQLAPIRSPEQFEPPSQDDGQVHSGEQPETTAYLGLTEAEVQALPDGLDQIYHENMRMNEEEEQKRQAEAHVQAQAQAQAQPHAHAHVWPGDTSAYPADAFANLNIPGSQHRAKTVHLGYLKNIAASRYSVFALQSEHGPGIELRGALDGSSTDEIRKGPLIRFEDIHLNEYFDSMSATLAEKWIRQLLAQVPGHNDAMVKWT